MALRRIMLVPIATAVVTAMSVTTAVVALAAPSSGAEIVQATAQSDRSLELQVYSPAMQRNVLVQVLLPADRSEPRGTFYLLDGNSGQTDTNNWLDSGNAAEFFADKNVNVVLPVGGTGTLYTDWQEEHPKFGVVKWETFLAEELPPLIDEVLGTNGRNAVGGISSGAHGALMLAERHPDVYQGVAGYSGCYLSEGIPGLLYTDLVVINGNGDSTKMWGEQGSEDWRSHDVIANAGNLRDTAVFLSSATGLPGPHESLETPDLANRVIVGGLLEAGSNLCTNQLADTLRADGVDVVRSAPAAGLHYWPYWRDQLAVSWPTIDGALAG